MTVFVSPDPANDPSSAHGVPGAWDVPPGDTWGSWLAHAALVFGVPLVCIVSFSPHGAVVQAFHGADVPLGPPLAPPALAQQGFCVVPDTRVDRATQHHPWVAGGLGVAFLAAVTLQAPTGQVLGALCVMDTAPRAFGDREARLLASLADMLVGDWALRQQAQKAAMQHQALEQSHGWLLESVSQDPLTQVANRRALMAFLDKTLALARRESRPLAVLLFDICGFKDINAEYGDASGDRVLADVAGRLSAGARGSELVGRMAGDEFMAVLYPCTPEQAALAAERFATAVQAQPVSMGPVVQIGVSMAVGLCATAPTDDLTPDELYRRAAQALDTAKDAQGLTAASA